MQKHFQLDFIGLQIWPSYMVYLMYHEIDAKLPRATSKETAMNRDFNTQLLDKVFVTCTIVKAEVSWRPRLITHGETMIIPDSTRTESNNTCIIHCFEENKDKNSTTWNTVLTLVLEIKNVLAPYRLITNLLAGTVEPRLTTTPFIRPPRYYGHILSNQT